MVLGKNERAVARSLGDPEKSRYAVIELALLRVFGICRILLPSSTQRKALRTNVDRTISD
jgi:hypothetical protein